MVSEGQRGFQVAAVSRADLTGLTESRVLIERELVRLAIEKGDDEWQVAARATLHRMTLAEVRIGPKYALTLAHKFLEDGQGAER